MPGGRGISEAGIQSQVQGRADYYASRWNEFVVVVDHELFLARTPLLVATRDAYDGPLPFASTPFSCIMWRCDKCWFFSSSSTTTVHQIPWPIFYPVSPSMISKNIPYPISPNHFYSGPGQTPVNSRWYLVGTNFDLRTSVGWISCCQSRTPEPSNLLWLSMSAVKWYTS